MANRRMISKSISTSKKLAKVSEGAALLFTWLIPHCDDGGNMDADPMAVKAIVMPMMPVGMPEIDGRLTELDNAGLISFYSVKNSKDEEERFLHINQWESHQTLRGDRIDVRYPDYKIRQNNDRYTNGKPAVSSTKHNLTEHNITKRTSSFSGKAGKVTARVSDGFVKFWKAYPRKTHRIEAIEVWNENLKELDSLVDTIIEFLKVAKESSAWEDKRYVPTAATFLRNRRWTDDPAAYESAQPPSLNLNEP